MKHLRKIASFGICAFVAWKFLGRFVPGLAVHKHIIYGAALALCTLRMGIMLVEMISGSVKWQKGFLPMVVLLFLASVFAGGGAWHVLAIVAAIAAETGLLVGIGYFVFRSRRSSDGSLEDRLLQSLESFFPPLIARYMVLEMMVMLSAFQGISRRASKAASHTSFSYVENSIFPVIPFLILLCAPADLLLTHSLLKITSRTWTVVLGLLDIWGVVWAYGTLVMMRLRPHEIVDFKLHLNKGIFGRAVVALSDVEDIDIIDDKSKPDKKSTGSAADLSVRGAPKLELRLNQSTEVMRWLGPEPRICSRIVVSADEPSVFCAAVIKAKKVSA